MSDHIRNLLLRNESLLNSLRAAWSEFLAHRSDEWLADLAKDLAAGREPSVELPDGWCRARDLLAAQSLLVEIRRRVEVALLEEE